MMLKCAGAAALGLALLAAPAKSQTAAELMQKGIYAQQTKGDLDTAIQLYRQILTSSGADRKTAAAAQYRLAESLLQKGDLAGAAREFQTLANYSEYKDVVASMAGRLPEPSTAPIVFSSGAGGSVIRHGKYSTEAGRGGTYLHSTGIQLTIQPGWTILDTDPDYVTVMVGGTGGSVQVIFKPEPNVVSAMAGRLKPFPVDLPASNSRTA